MGVLDALGTDQVFYYFEEISKIPHGSGNEAALADYLMDFAQQRGLSARKDTANNVIIKKPASKGYESASAVILQGHLDMVCEKNADTIHDFTKDAIPLQIEGDFITAKGTTLGGDDGIAVAYMMALLAHPTLEHPALECVFTTDEETGMEGVRALDTSDLTGKYLLNLDSEEEGKFLISSSGGRRVKVSLAANRMPKPAAQTGFLLRISGLLGGHSGSDINLERANANKLMGRVLSALSDLPYSLVSVDGGMFDNAICREANAVLTMQPSDAQKAEQLLAQLQKTIYAEYRHAETDILITWEPLREEITNVLTTETKENIISLLLLLPYGVESMSLAISNLVECSSNLGIVSTKANEIIFENAVRSAVDSRKEALCAKIERIAALCHAKVESFGDYPGWINKENSALLSLLQATYQDVTQKEPMPTAIHAGVECSLFAVKMPDLDMISLGPDLFDVHTPQERLSISSTIRVWDVLKETLRRMKPHQV